MATPSCPYLSQCPTGGGDTDECEVMRRGAKPGGVIQTEPCGGLETASDSNVRHRDVEQPELYLCTNIEHLYLYRDIGCRAARILWRRRTSCQCANTHCHSAVILEKSFLAEYAPCAICRVRAPYLPCH